jgi:sulfite exporter TauE/SafE
MTSLVTGLLLGVLGSIHCAGMCGPILLTVNRFGSGGQSVYTRMLVYHTARVFTYALIGIAAGYTGTILTMSGLGRAIAITSGTLLVASATGVTAEMRVKRLPAAWSSIVVRAGAAAAGLVRTHPVAGYIVLGLANGLLPCGLLYAALASSVAIGSVGGSLIFMVAFGLGTTPLLMSVALSTILVPASVKRRISLAGPIAMALVGTLLIARGILPPERLEHRHNNHQILSLEPLDFARDKP